MIGIGTLDRRDPERKGQVRPEGGEAELGTCSDRRRAAERLAQ